MAGKEQLKVGFVGAGNVVRSMHLPVLKSMPERFEVLGFADTDRGKADEMAETVPGADAHESLSAMLSAHPELDLVTVATRPYTTHAPLAIEALEAGCNAYVEKPFTISLGHAREMFETAQEQGKTLCAYQNRRFEVAFLAFQQALRDGVLGELRFLRRRISAGRTAGELLNFGTHVIDQVVCLTDGRQPRELTATLQNPEADYNGPAGFFKLAMRYDDGLVAEVERLPDSEQVNYFYAAGTEGSYRQQWADNLADLFRKQMDLVCPDEAWLPTDFEDELPGVFDLQGSLYYRCYRSMWEHLVHGAPQPVSPHDTLLQFAIIEAMFRSARENRSVPVESV